jgi:hypothetical protein
MLRLRQAIHGRLKQLHPQTIRQLFYGLVSAGEIEKTDADYQNVVVRLTAEMRLAGEIPWGWISDHTRWMRKPTTFDSLADALEWTQDSYRRAVWGNQQAYVEIWLEKNALAGVFYQVTGRWDVPLMVTVGFPSLTYLYSAAATISEVGKPAFIYYFGDFDPSGVQIPKTVEQRLRQFAPDSEIHFECRAVQEWQIDTWNLPTRPTKKSDSRSKAFGDRSVELDAIPPEKLREQIQACIDEHLDYDAFERLKTVEDAEKDTLDTIVGRFREEDEE